MELPTTVKFPDTFSKSTPPWADGVLYWNWIEEAFRDTKIKPMDFDAVVERNGHFLIIESKNPGVDIPQGQMITLEHLWQLGRFTIFFVWGKVNVMGMYIWWPPNSNAYRQSISHVTPDIATRYVYQWRQCAEGKLDWPIKPNWVK